MLLIALGAFRTSPAQSLYIEADEPSLTTRRLKLSLNYVLKLKSLPENPAYSCVFESENTKLFEELESKVPPLGIRILPHLEKSKLNLNLVDDAPSLDIVPWKLSVPAVRFDLASFKIKTWWGWAAGRACSGWSWTRGVVGQLKLLFSMPVKGSFSQVARLTQ